LVLTDVDSLGGEVLMSTMRWEMENEVRQSAAVAESDAVVRARKVERALADTRARLEMLAREQAVQEAELLRIRAEAMEQLAPPAPETAIGSQRPGEPETQLRVRLYIAGPSPNSATALSNLRGALVLCPEHLVDLEIIDVVSQPERVMRDGVSVTPMLVRMEPLPARRVLGSLRDRGLLLAALGLDEAPGE
jgi:circadian clock protein KaiB